MDIGVSILQGKSKLRVGIIANIQAYTQVKVDGETPKGGLVRGHDKQVCAIYFPGGIFYHTRV